MIRDRMQLVASLCHKASNMPHHSDSTSTDISRKAMAWGLLTIWLVYSAAALGWHLARDPLLSSYICMKRLP